MKVGPSLVATVIAEYVLAIGNDRIDVASQVAFWKQRSLLIIIIIIIIIINIPLFYGLRRRYCLVTFCLFI